MLQAAATASPRNHKQQLCWSNRPNCATGRCQHQRQELGVTRPQICCSQASRNASARQRARANRIQGSRRQQPLANCMQYAAPARRQPIEPQSGTTICPQICSMHKALRTVVCTKNNFLHKRYWCAGVYRCAVAPPAPCTPSSYGSAGSTAASNGSTDTQLCSCADHILHTCTTLRLPLSSAQTLLSAKKKLSNLLPAPRAPTPTRATRKSPPAALKATSKHRSAKPMHVADMTHRLACWPFIKLICMRMEDTHTQGFFSTQVVTSKQELGPCPVHN